MLGERNRGLQIHQRRWIAPTGHLQVAATKLCGRAVRPGKRVIETVAAGARQLTRCRQRWIGKQLGPQRGHLLDGGSIPKSAWPKAGQTNVRGCSALAHNCMISGERARSE